MVRTTSSYRYLDLQLLSTFVDAETLTGTVWWE